MLTNNHKRVVAVIMFVVTFILAALLLKCDSSTPPVKDPKEERGKMDPSKFDKDTTFVYNNTDIENEMP